MASTPAHGALVHDKEALAAAAAARAQERAEAAAHAAQAAHPAAAVAASPAVSGPMAKLIMEAKRKFMTCLEDELLDYKHNHPQIIENCANLLIKIFSNILHNPQEQKYRQIKATSNAFKSHVSGVKGGEKLMMLAGFKVQVVDLTKYWVFESDSHGLKDSILRECCSVLERALHLIHEKAERKRKETEGKADAEKLRKEQILLQLEDDKLDRKIRQEVVVLPAVVAAEPLPSEVPHGGGRARRGSRGEEDPAGEEEEEDGA